MDNDERKTRTLELGDQTKTDLEHAAQDYEAFKAACTALNPKLISVYQSAGLKPPQASPVEVMKYTQVGQQAQSSEVADVLEVLGDISLFVGLTQQLGPAATKFLVNKKIVPASFGEKELISKSITLYEDALGASRGVAGPPAKVDIEITGGDVAGHVVAGVLAGAAVGVLDGIIWVAEEETLKKDLRKAITALHPLRTATLLCRKKTALALQSIKSVDALLDAIDNQAPSLKKQELDDKNNAVVKIVENLINKGSTLADVVAELKQRDTTNKSVTTDDPDYQTA